MQEIEKSENKVVIRCEICGSRRIVKKDGSFICQSCGIGYSLDEIKKMLQNGQQSNVAGDRCDENYENDDKCENDKDRKI